MWFDAWDGVRVFALINYFALQNQLASPTLNNFPFKNFQFSPLSPLGWWFVLTSGHQGHMLVDEVNDGNLFFWLVKGFFHILAAWFSQHFLIPIDWFYGWMVAPDVLQWTVYSWKMGRSSWTKTEMWQSEQHPGFKSPVFCMVQKSLCDFHAWILLPSRPAIWYWIQLRQQPSGHGIWRVWSTIYRVNHWFNSSKAMASVKLFLRRFLSLFTEFKHAQVRL